uniref:DNA-(apurinic or apyrimidinic site) lyase n=1 Tax=Syphacia muris TaxID=451379 RepID=A0A0N5AKB4_9BILA
MQFDKFSLCKPTFLECPVSELNFTAVLLNGQSFRFISWILWKVLRSKEKCSKQKDFFIGVAFGRVWKLWRENQKSIAFQVLHKFSSAVGDDKRVLEDYFQLHVSLRDLYKIWSKCDPHFCQVVTSNLEVLSGIRILAQDVFETVISFICSSNNNIRRISKMVEELCKIYGESVTFQQENMTFYDLPDLQKMADDEQLEIKLRANGFGYRSKYLQQAVRMIKELGGKKWLNSLALLPYETAKEKLEIIPGIGPKVADCICLMGLHMHRVVPVDTHVLQLTRALYCPELMNKTNMNRATYSNISTTWQNIFGDYAGWAQSVLFNAHLKHFEVGSNFKKRGKLV